MKTKILVTGANGQLGKTLKQVCKIESLPNLEFTYLSKEDLDITNKNEVEKHFSKEKYNYCVNCAAYTNVEQAELSPEIAFKVNAEAVKNIAWASNNNNVKLIHISTDYVFNGTKTKAYTELDMANPINVYGASKLKGEQYIKEVFSHFYIIRTSWLYSVNGHNFLKTILNKLKTETDLKITNQQTGTPTSCASLSLFIIHIIKNSKVAYGIYNFSDNGQTTWYGFAKEILKNCNKNHILGTITLSNQYKTKAKRPKNSILDLTKTKTIYNSIKNWQKEVKKTVVILEKE